MGPRERTCTGSPRGEAPRFKDVHRAEKRRPAAGLPADCGRSAARGVRGCCPSWRGATSDTAAREGPEAESQHGPARIPDPCSGRGSRNAPRTRCVRLGGASRSETRVSVSRAAHRRARAAGGVPARAARERFDQGAYRDCALSFTCARSGRGMQRCRRRARSAPSRPSRGRAGPPCRWRRMRCR